MLWRGVWREHRTKRTQVDSAPVPTSLFAPVILLYPAKRRPEWSLSDWLSAGLCRRSSGKKSPPCCRKDPTSCPHGWTARHLTLTGCAGEPPTVLTLRVLARSDALCSRFFLKTRVGAWSCLVCSKVVTALIF